MEEHGFVHKSVLLYETVGSLNIKPGGIYVDGTLGGGGHAYEVCKRQLPNQRLQLPRQSQQRQNIQLREHYQTLV